MRQHVLWTVWLGWITAVLAQDVEIKPERENGTYKAGEEARWIIQTQGPEPVDAGYVIKRGGLTEAGSGTISLHNGTATIGQKMEGPGWLLLELTRTNGQGKAIKRLGGAVFSPEQIEPSMPKPKDFDAFWKAKLEELALVPANPTLSAADSGIAEVEYFHVTMDNIRNSKVHGQLAKPKGKSKLPAMLIVQWAGVYPLQRSWAVDRAKEGWLALNILAHDLPPFESEAFYKQHNEGPLKDYPGIGNDDKETSYFLRMYLSCYRAAEYLRHHPDWDGKVLVATGGSQGGLQALMIAGLHPGITAALANVPAGCDHTGPDAGRQPGWPMWPWKAGDKDPAKVKQASRYYDVVNFASNIRCPVLVGIGGIDTVCAPPGIFAAFNQVKGPKEGVYMPTADHSGKHDAYYARFQKWQTAARLGNPLPPAP